MKKYLIILFLPLTVILTTEFTACVSTRHIEARSGAQLWAENCIRCHNVPSPTDFSDSQWDLIGTHMRLRASLTEMETNKIIEFLKTAN